MLLGYRERLRVGRRIGADQRGADFQRQNLEVRRIHGQHTGAVDGKAASDFDTAEHGIGCDREVVGVLLDLQDPVVEVPAERRGQRVIRHARRVVFPWSGPYRRLVGGDLLLEPVFESVQREVSPGKRKRILDQEEEFLGQVCGRKFIQPGFQKKKILGGYLLARRFAADIQGSVLFPGIIIPEAGCVVEVSSGIQFCEVIGELDAAEGVVLHIRLLGVYDDLLQVAGQKYMAVLRLQEIRPQRAPPGGGDMAGIDLLPFLRVIPELALRAAVQERNGRAFQLGVAAAGRNDPVLDAEGVAEDEFLHADVLPGQDQAERISVHRNRSGSVLSGEVIADVPGGDGTGALNGRRDGGKRGVHGHVPAPGLDGTGRERHGLRITGSEEHLRLHDIGSALPAEQIQPG